VPMTESFYFLFSRNVMICADRQLDAEQCNRPLWVCGKEHNLYRINHSGQVLGTELSFGVDL